MAFYRELSLYSERIDRDEIRTLFDHLTRRGLPFLGFIDMALIFSSIPSPIIVQREQNTLKFYMRDSRKINQLSNLLFPFRLGEKVEIKRAEGKLFPPPQIYFIGKENFLNFLIKEDIMEFSFKVRRILGKFIGTFRAVDANGQRYFAIVSDPESFFEVDLEKHPQIYIEVLEPIPKSISVDAKFPLFEGQNTKIGIESFDPIQHSLIVGESGSGKTKSIYMIIKALEQRYGDNIRILVLDPHGEFLRLMPEQKIIDFKKNYIEPLAISSAGTAGKTPLLTQLITQLMSSSIGEENKYSERVLFYSTYLLSSVDKLTLKAISNLLTDPAVRMELTTKSDVDEARRFFDQEYQDIYIHHFNDAVLPILNFVGEYELYLGKTMKKENLLEVLEKNRVTIASFDPNFFGKRMIKFLAGALINQMYILAITGQIKTPTIILIDEFPRVETLVMKDLLSETRKFNLYAYLSMQYLAQLRKEILDSIVSNVKNIISFKTNRQDATLVSSIMEIKLEEYFKKSRSTTELEESKKEMFVRLHQRECIVRLFDGKKYMLPMKLKSSDMNNFMGKEIRPPPGGYDKPIVQEVGMTQPAPSAEYKPPAGPEQAPEAGSEAAKQENEKEFFMQKDSFGPQALKKEEKSCKRTVLALKHSKKRKKSCKFLKKSQSLLNLKCLLGSQSPKCQSLKSSLRKKFPLLKKNKNLYTSLLLLNQLSQMSLKSRQQ